MFQLCKKSLDVQSLKFIVTVKAVELVVGILNNTIEMTSQVDKIYDTAITS